MSNESATDTLRNWGTKSIGQGFLDVKKREDEDRDWREGVLSILSQDDRSETIVALVLGARRKRGG